MDQQTHNQSSQAKKDITSNVKEGVNKMKDQVSEMESSVFNSAKDALNTASEKISQGYDVASQEFKKVSSQAEGMIKQNPLIAIGVAATLGWAAGRFLGSRSAPSERT